MTIKGSIVKSLLSLMLCGGMALFANSAFARSGSGVELSKSGDNYGIIAQVEEATGKIFSGMIFVVDSSSTLDRDVAANGSFRRPFTTIDYAIGRASARTANTNPAANSGSLILVLPGHTETAIDAADEIDADLAGLTVWGVGSGSERPTLTFTGAAGEFTIGADNTTVGNIRFLSSITDVLKAINVEDSVNDPRIINCWFGVDASGTDEFTDVINLAGHNDRFVIEGNIIEMRQGGSEIGINIDNVCASGTIKNNIIRGDYSTANISGDTTLSTSILIEDNLLVNGIGGNLNAQPAIELLTGTTGIISDNYIVCDESTKAASIIADTCLRFENYYNEHILTGTGGLIGTASSGIN